MERVLVALLDGILQVDQEVAHGISQVRTPVATKVLTSATGLGSATAALVLLGLFYLAGWDEEWRQSLTALALSGMVVGTLMVTIQRPFPPDPVCLTDGAETVAKSFPSGHAASVTVFAMTARKSESLPFAPAAVLALLIAFSRIYLGTHYLSDTVAGVLIGAGAFFVAARLRQRVEWLP